MTRSKQIIKSLIRPLRIGFSLLLIVSFELNGPIPYAIALATEATSSSQSTSPTPNPSASPLVETPSPTDTPTPAVSSTPTPTTSPIPFTPTVSPLIPPTPTPTETIPVSPTPTASPTPTPSISLTPTAPTLETIPSASPSSTSIDTLTPTFAPMGASGIVGTSATIRLPFEIKPFAEKFYKAGEIVKTTILNTKATNLKINILDPGDNEIKTNLQKEEDGDNTKIIIAPLRSFKPGQYTLKATDISGKTSKQSFTWGRLLLNTNKTTYLENEETKVKITAFGPNGKTDCNAKITLSVQSEKASFDEKFSTLNNTVSASPSCQKNDKNGSPNYEVSFKTKGEGTYILDLTAELNQETLSLTDSFLVKKSTPLTIERNLPSKTEAGRTYAGEIKIAANEDFEGTIRETAPADFQISDPEKGEGLKSVVEKNSQVLGAAISLNNLPDLDLPFNGNFVKTQSFGEIATDENLKKHYQDLGYKGHDGLDFDMPEKTPIFAADSGTAKVENDKDYGTTVIINHSWGKTYYAHLSEVNIKDDQNITKGQEIALSGNSGYSTAPHFHFAIKPINNDQNNGYQGKIDPAPYLPLPQAEFKTSEKVITWDISLKKGEEKILAYKFTTPKAAPAVYLLGPLVISSTNEKSSETSSSNLLITESRRWQIAGVETRVASGAISKHTQKSRRLTVTGDRNQKLNVNADEYPYFEVDLSSEKYARTWSKSQDALKKETDITIEHQKTADVKLSADVNFDQNSKKLIITPRPENDFRPGLYRLSVKTNEVNVEQDFAWGVLAVNTNKSVYSLNEKAYLQMATLDDLGHTLCNASLKLEIKNPKSEITTLSTKDATIINSKTCGIDNVTDNPDYFAYYKTSKAGVYEMRLTNLDNGYEINDSFEVRENLSFDIERVAATRINPLRANYKMTIKIKANEDFDETITEQIPSSFQITPDKNIRIETIEKLQYLNWDKKINKGEEITLEYEYDAPDISPQFYLLGPLTLGDWQEKRVWQIASDAINSNTHGMVAYQLSAQASTPKIQTFTGSNWNTAQNANDVTGTVQWIVTKANPKRDEIVIGTLDASNDIKVQLCTYAGSCGSVKTLTTSASTNATRVFDIEIEKSSGDVLVVYETGTNQQITYDRWNGSAWAGAATLTIGTASTLNSYWLDLFGAYDSSSPNPDNMMLCVETAVTSTYPDLYCAPWTGSSNSFGTVQQISLTEEPVTSEGFYGAYEDVSGDFIVFFSKQDVAILQYYTYVGTTWTLGTGRTSAAAAIFNFRAAVYPKTNRIMACWMVDTTSDDLDCQEWSGTAIQTGVSVDAGIEAVSHPTRHMDVAPVLGTDGFLVMDPVSNQDYYTFSQCTSLANCQAGTWSARTPDTTDLGVDTRWGQLYADPNGIGDLVWWGTDQTASNGWYEGRITCNTSGCNRRESAKVLGGGITSLSFESAMFAYVTYAAPSALLTQEGYTFENDDGTGSGDGTVQAGTSFTSGKTITSVKKGERFSTRVQIKNTGSGPLTSPLALFYDRNDGIFTRVEATNSAQTASGNCTDTNYDCITVDNANVGSYSSIAFDTSGIPWISYWTVNTQLTAAKYVGSGGNCTSGAWQCWAIDTGGVIAGAYSSIAFDSKGTPWISYYDQNGSDLRVAKYVGSGGSCTASAAWDCTEVDTGGAADVGAWTSIAFDHNGKAWVSYYDATNTQLKVADYVGSSGNCTSAAWNCTAVDNAAGEGEYSSIAIDSSNNPWVSYYDHGDGTCSGGGECGLKVATYVGGTGGSCTSTAWNCTKVDSGVTDIGQYTSIAFDPSGNAAVSYYDVTNTQLKVANYVGSGGGCTSAAWNCTAVDNAAGVGEWTSIAYAADGNPWVSYMDHGDGTCSGGGECGLKVARYVGGASGNCTSTNWSCSKVDSSVTETGGHTSIGFDPYGRAWISYRAETNSDLRVANINRRGEINITPGLSANNGASITTSHADMTSATDTTGKGDADCLTATTWNNGIWYESQEGNGFTLPAGNTTSQCMEVAFMLDTSQAIANTTYRLVIASKDSWNPAKSLWRGPISFASNSIPTLTTEASTTLRVSKDNTPILPNCTDTSWGCYSFDNAVNANNWFSLVIDNSGAPWIAYFDPGTTSLKVAHYVGTGGTGCSTAGNTSWDCITVDNTGTSTGENPALAVDHQGHVWVSYRDVTSTNLKVATNYDHPDMAPCTATGWDCTTIADVTFVVDWETSIAIDPAGNPWISFYDYTDTDLLVARYVGSGGSCAWNDTWDCTIVDNAGGDSDSIAFDSQGKAWISYYDRGNTNFKVAEFVGAGGNCTSPAWNCTTVDSSGSVGQTTSLRINPITDQPWAAYWDQTNTGLKIANYVGSGGNCSSTAWNCQTIQNGQSYASDPSVAFDIYGTPWVQFAHLTGVSASTFKVAKYVGSGGSCSNTAWDCTTVDSSGGDAGEYGCGHALAFDQSGVPWGAYIDKNVSEIKVAKLHVPPRKDDSKYRLDVGKAPRTESGSCSSNTDKKGYCGITANDSDYDQVAALTSERPLFTFTARNTNNTDALSATWIGQSTVAPSSKTITMQVYNVSTKAWENLSPYDTDTCASTGANTDCQITDGPASTYSNYYEANGSNYWAYFRVWQTENTAAETLKSDSISITFGTVTYSITGTVYGTNESTPVATGPLVRVKVNGSGDFSANANGSGVYNVTGITMSASNSLSIYLDTGGGITGATFTRSTGANMTDIHIYQDRAATRCDFSNCSLTNDDIYKWDKTGDTDIHANVDNASGGALTVDNDWKLLVVANTLAPGGAITTSPGGASSYSGNVEVKSGAVLNMSTYALSIGGSYANGGTATLSSNTTTFTSTTTGQTLSGTLNGTSAFNKLAFNGSGGTWAIQNPILITAANATDTLQITAGTVTLGNGTGDDLDVRGKFVVSSGATFQTLSTLAEGSTIIVDINANTSPPACANCIVNASGTFTINKNATLRFNSNASVQSGIEVSSTGVLNITGSRDYNDTTVTSNAPDTKVCATADITADQTGKTIMMTSGLAKSRIYTIQSTISNGSDAGCSGGGVGDSNTVTDSYATTDSTPTVSDLVAGYSKSICTSKTTLITADDETIGQYIHDTTTNTYFLIVDSFNNAGGCGAGNDKFYVIGSPSSLSSLSTNDTIKISDGIRASDTYEILDYATVTAHATNHGYIYSQASSETSIQYADISQLGDSAVGNCNVPTANKCGITAVSVNGYTAGQSFSMQDSYIHDMVKPFATSSVNKATISSNYIYNNSGDRGLVLSGSNNNTISNNRIIGGTGWSIGVDLTGSASYNNVVAGNFISITSSYTIEASNGSENTVWYNNMLFRGGPGLHSDITNKQIIADSTIFHMSGIGIDFYGSNSNQVVGNNIFGTNIGSEPYNNTTSVTYYIDNTFGVEQANSAADIDMNSATDQVYMYNNKFASTTEVRNVPASGAVAISFKHDQTNGLSRVWGQYTIPADTAETTQVDERIQKFNYADATYPDSFTPHIWYGTGTEGNLSLQFNGSMIGSLNHYLYRLTYNGTNWDVYRNEASIGTATTSVQFTDGTTNVRFTIPAQTPGNGDTYTFFAYKTSGDTSVQKTVTQMQTGGYLQADTGKTLQLLGGSAANQTLLQKDSGATSYALTITGTINANYYKITGTDNNGLNIGTGATVTDLSYGVYDDTGGTVVGNSTYVKVVAAVLNGGAKTWTGVTFDDGTTDSNIKYNVTLSGTPTACGNSWTFNSNGNKGGLTNGEANDSDVDGNCGGVGYILWTTYTPVTGPTTDQQMRHGTWFNNNVKQPFTF